MYISLTNTCHVISRKFELLFGQYTLPTLWRKLLSLFYGRADLTAASLFIGHFSGEQIFCSWQCISEGGEEGRAIEQQYLGQNVPASSTPLLKSELCTVKKKTVLLVAAIVFCYLFQFEFPALSSQLFGQLMDVHVGGQADDVCHLLYGANYLDWYFTVHHGVLACCGLSEMEHK